jgi:protease I
MELFYPLYRLQEEGWTVDIASHAKKTITGQRGYECKANLSFKDVRPERYALLVIPGGRAPEAVRLDTDAVRITKHFFEKSLPVASICHGAQVLISAGVLKGRKLTCWKGIRDDVIAAGGEFRDCEVAEDHNLITSRFPSDLPFFMRDIFRMFEEPRLKEVVGG